ncbi:hypothetical protein KFU94_37700 [Chloroflexi bacterium TSY]|nr:hypothetical protein [Chloroflexi bacterium TSY]
MMILNDLYPTWTFFSRQEIAEIVPIIQQNFEHPFIEGYDPEWKGLIAMHEIEAYDWLAFFYMF